MAKAPARLVAVGLATLGFLPGCAGPGPIRDRITTQGTLKTMVGQLQFENEKLRREVVDLRAETVRVGDERDREKSLNTELTAKVDQLRGFAGQDRAEPLVDNVPPGPKSLPAGRSTKPGRKPPFARIPARNEPAPILDARPDALDDPAPPRPRPIDLGPESRRGDDDDSRWLPVARDPRPIRTIR